MTSRFVSTGLLFVLAALASGCASYRTTSNVDSTAPAPANASATTGTQPIQVLLSESGLPGRQFKEIGPVEVTIKKLTVFHKDPTREQADEALIERARALGADAVINIVYKSGIGFTTWGYIEAKGVAVKLL